MFHCDRDAFHITQHVKVRLDNVLLSYVMERHGPGDRNNNGDRLSLVCLHTVSTIGSLTGDESNLIDHIVISGLFRSCLLNTRGGVVICRLTFLVHRYCVCHENSMSIRDPAVVC